MVGDSNSSSLSIQLTKSIKPTGVASLISTFAAVIRCAVN